MDNPVTSTAGPGAVHVYRPHQENTYYLRDMISVLRERWLVFLLVFAVVSAPAIWVVLSLRPSFVATTRVLIEPNERMRVNLDSAVTGITLDGESVRSEVEVLKSPDLALRVIHRLLPRIIKDLEPEKRGVFLAVSELKAQLGFQKAPEDESQVARFLRRLSVTPVERSRVITVTYRSYDPEIAADAANALATEYVEMALTKKREGTREAAEWLARRISELQSSIDASERSIEAYRQQHGLVQGDGTGLIAERLSHANLALAQARNRAADVNARLSRFSGETSPDRISEVLNSPVIRRLREFEAEAAKRTAELATTTGEASPTLIAQRNSLARMRQSISEEVARIREGVRHEAAAARSMEDTLQQEVDALTRKLNDLRTATIGLRAMEREAGATRAIYENVLLRTKDVVAQESFLLRDARIIGHAIPPPGPTTPSPAILLAGCCAAGILAAGAMVRLIVHFEPGFRRVEDIERATRVNVLSAIPKIKFGEGKRGFDGGTFDEQRTRFAGSIEMLLGRIMMRKLSSRGTVLSVVSCLPSEGKTFLTLSLAHLAARIGYRCLVIDGDFRAPRITRSLGLQARPGLADVLDRSRKVVEVTTAVGNSGFYAMPVGQSTQSIQRLLGGTVYRSMIDGLTNDYDLIIIDTSPIMAAAEAEILAQTADQTLLVVQWKTTPRAVVQDGIERLSKATGAIAGIAFSQVSPRQSRYDAYGRLAAGPVPYAG